MPITYPPAPVSLSGDIETISRFLNSPLLITRRLRTLAEQRFISDVILTGRFQAQGGSVLYEQSETIFTDRTPTGVDPGSEYPMTGAVTGAAAVAATVKWGQDAIVTDEAIKRLNIDPVNRAMTKLVNQMVKTIDGIALSAITSAVTQTQAAVTAWNVPATAKILTDVLLAVAQIRALNQGYDPDTLVVNDSKFAYIMADPTVTNALRREDLRNPVYTGDFPIIAGLRVLPTSNAPSANPIVLDSRMLGGMADEMLGGPGYTGAVQGVEAKSMRNDEQDRWRLRARRVTVPVIIEPNSAVTITGT